jgi:hypothetical protein
MQCYKKAVIFTIIKRKTHRIGWVFLYFKEAVLFVHVISHYGICSNTLSALV